MTTVIDSLVVELGLDPSKFSKGAAQSIDTLRKLEEANDKRSKGAVDSSKKEGQALTGLKTQALELFAVLSGGRGVIDFISHLTDADAAVGRVSRSTNVSASTLSKWQGAARLLGGDAESMAQSFIKMNDAVEGFRHGFGNPQFIATLAGISRAGGSPIDVTKGLEETYLALADNLHAIAQREGVGAAGAIGRQAGIDPAMLDMFIKGREVTKQILDQINAFGPATERSADAAGELQRRWNSIFLRTEGSGRQAGIIPDILAASDFLNMTPSEAWAYLNRTDRATNNLSSRPKSLTPGFEASPTASGGFNSPREKEDFIRSEAIKRGISPDAAMAVARSEGFSSFLGDNGTSGGSFQLHVTPGGRGNAVGDQFRRQTGLDPLDKANEARTIQFALDDAKAHGWGAYHGAARVGLGQWAGINQPGAGSGGQSVQQTFTGPIAITGVKDAADFQNKLRDLGLRRAAEANQSPVGGE